MAKDRLVELTEVKDECNCGGCISRTKNGHCRYQNRKVEAIWFCANYWWKGDAPRR